MLRWGKHTVITLEEASRFNPGLYERLVTTLMKDGNVSLIDAREIAQKEMRRRVTEYKVTDPKRWRLFMETL